MRIAQVAPLYESVPPALYGGTERVVSWLTEELVRLGHDVTLFSSGDSLTTARLVPACKRALRLDPGCVDQLAHHIVMLDLVFSEKDNFDLFHFHTDYLHFPLSRREQILGAGGEYLAFLGRTSPEKGLDQAIEIAKRTGMPLKIAAKIDKIDVPYYERVIKPLLDHPLVEFIGEIGYPDKNEFLGNAAALLFPIDWNEPFGLVMIEAMACGTPVIAYPLGSVPEIVRDGVTGFIVPDLENAVRAVKRIKEILHSDQVIAGR